MTATLLWRRLRAASRDPARLARLCQTYPDLMAPILTGDALDDVLDKGRAWLDESASATLARARDIGEGGEREFVEADERFHEIAPCPIVFAWRSSPGRAYAPAAVVEGVIRVGAPQERVGRAEFQHAVEEALTLADAMVPGPERPILRLRREEWASMLDDGSAGFAVFFHAVCLLLAVPVMGNLAISAGLENGRLVPATRIGDKARAVRRSGRSVFVVCGDDAAREAAEAKPELKVIEIAPGKNAAAAFALVFTTLFRWKLWRPTHVIPVARFLLERARMSVYRGADAIDDIARVITVLEFSPPPPGGDEDLDALRLDAFRLKCRLLAAKNNWDDLAHALVGLCYLLEALEKSESCPSNFEDAYCDWPIYMAEFCQGLGLTSDVREYLTDARRRAEKFWPKNRRRMERIDEVEKRTTSRSG